MHELAAKRPLRIYVAGPYTADTDEKIQHNVRRAIDMGVALMNLGHDPFIPHLSYHTDLRAKKLNVCLPWPRWMEWCLSHLEGCDALLFMGSSPGAQIEKQYAIDIGLPVYESIHDIQPVRRENGIIYNIVHRGSAGC